MTEIGLFDAIHTARVLRRFKPDPVPDELITRILEAAICAPSGGNAQEWIFAVIADGEQRRRVGAVYARASKLERPFYQNRPTRAHLYLVVGGPARPFKDTRARDIRPVTTQIDDEQEVTVWALMLVLGLSILMAGYILCAKTSGFACRTSPTNVTTVMVAERIAGNKLSALASGLGIPTN